jgi:hypothetical protein
VAYEKNVFFGACTQRRRRRARRRQPNEDDADDGDDICDGSATDVEQNAFSFTLFSTHTLLLVRLCPDMLIVSFVSFKRRTASLSSSPLSSSPSSSPLNRNPRRKVGERARKAFQSNKKWFIYIRRREDLHTCPTHPSTRHCPSPTPATSPHQPHLSLSLSISHSPLPSTAKHLSSGCAEHRASHHPRAHARLEVLAGLNGLLHRRQAHLTSLSLRVCVCVCGVCVCVCGVWGVGCGVCVVRCGVVSWGVWCVWCRVVCVWRESRDQACPSRRHSLAQPGHGTCSS